MINIKPLNIKAEKIEGILGKMRGLMFSRKRNLIFVFKRERRTGIHMLFVFFPLIVVWIDEKKKIMAFRKMLPFCSFHEAKAKYVLEIPYDKRIFKKISKLKSLNFSVGCI